MTTEPGSGLGIVDARNIVGMLESTGIDLDPAERSLIDELASRMPGGDDDDDDPADAVEQFLSPGAEQPAQRWAALIAAHLYDGANPESLTRPVWTIPAAPRGRPLSRMEQAICRVTVNRWPGTSHTTQAQYALAERSATSGELCKLRVDAVHIGSTARVHLPGGRDQNARVVQLDDWGTRVLISRMCARPADPTSMLFVYDGADPGSAKAQASASGNLARVLRVAGLGADPTLIPTSIRNTCACRVYERGEGIESAAEAIGCRSLDKVRQLVRSAPTA